MSKLTMASLLVSSAALFPVAAQAQSQGPALPDGAGKQLVESLCTGCHQTNMITAQLRLYPRGLEGTRQHDDRYLRRCGGPGDNHRLSGNPFPAEHPQCRQADAGYRAGFVQGMEDTDPRSALARSGAGGRRDHLVGRTMGQPDRADQSGDRRDEGIPAAGQRHAAHRDARRQGQHLVHRQRERDGRLSRSDHRQDHRIQDARSRREGSAYADLRPQGHRLVHAAEQQHAGPSRPGDR